MSSVVSVDWFDKGRRVAVASASSVLGSGDSHHMAERIEASSGLPQGGHSADESQRTDELKWKQPLAAAFSKTLWLLLLFAMIPSVAALDCDIDLSLLPNYGFAQCDAGCDSCNFSLVNGYFLYATIECLPLVPCFVFANTGAELDETTVNGSLASALTLYTNNTFFAWSNAIIHAPANRGDFRFEATNTQGVFQQTTIHAVNTGVLDFVIHSDEYNSPLRPEIYSVFVYASTSNELTFWLGEDTRYAVNHDSVIQCPKNGKCKWESNGQRYDYEAIHMRVVNVSTHPSTDLQLLCGNSLACAGIHVDCDDSAENCEMQYASDWQCVGSLDLTNGCTAIPTTTPKPISTTPKPISTTPTPTLSTESQSDSESSGFLVYGLVLGFFMLF